jgi:hypothetical protein
LVPNFEECLPGVTLNFEFIVCGELHGPSSVVGLPQWVELLDNELLVFVVDVVAFSSCFGSFCFPMMRFFLCFFLFVSDFVVAFSI